MKKNISEIEKRKIFPGIKGQFIHTKNNTIGFIEIEAEAELPEHAHIHEQTTQVIEGKLELIISGKNYILKPGMLITIPPNAVHSAKALSFCRVTDIFCPVREDYK